MAMKNTFYKAEYEWIVQDSISYNYTPFCTKSTFFRYIAGIPRQPAILMISDPLTGPKIDLSVESDHPVILYKSYWLPRQ